MDHESIYLEGNRRATGKEILRFVRYPTLMAVFKGPLLFWIPSAHPTHLSCLFTIPFVSLSDLALCLQIAVPFRTQYQNFLRTFFPLIYATFSADLVLIG